MRINIRPRGKKNSPLVTFLHRIVHEGEYHPEVRGHAISMLFSSFHASPFRIDKSPVSGKDAKFAALKRACGGDAVTLPLLIRRC